MSHNIDFSKLTAECVYIDIEKGKHLKSFSYARDKLEYLEKLLEHMLADCNWFGEQCKIMAAHYSSMQKDLRENPNDFSVEHAIHATSKNPHVLYDYAVALSAGRDKLHDAIASVDVIIAAFKRAESEAEENSKEVLKKILRAIDLMDSYLKVDF